MTVVSIAHGWAGVAKDMDVRERRDQWSALPMDGQASRRTWMSESDVVSGQ